MSLTGESLNYYEQLKISRDSSFSEIKRAFMEVSQACHPARNPTSVLVNQAKFAEVCEAYDVLSQMHLRAIYDKYGEFGLKEGIIDAQGVRHGGGYFLQSSPEAIYDKVYTSTDVQTDQRDMDGSDLQGSMFGDAFRGLASVPSYVPSDIEVTVECTLAEFYVGSMKKVEYTSAEVQHDARTIKQVPRMLNVQVHPGFSEKTVLTYKNKGNEVIGKDATNLIVKFKQIANPDWRRAGDDLILTHKVSLASSMNMEPLKITTLDNRVRSLCFDEMIVPQTVRLVPGEGMPKGVSADSTEEGEDRPMKSKHISEQPRGDLYIKFIVDIPTNLSMDQRKTILAALAANQEQLEN